MSQLTLPIAWSQRDEADRLLITSANVEAIALVRAWERWPSPATLLIGPVRSGRTLIGRMFAEESGGTFVDDADGRDEVCLFNLWNEAKESGRPLLLIARDAPPAWRIGLPDLRTRLATAAIARILPPDEAIAAALIGDGLARAGSAFAPDMPEFVARRVTRCYEAIDRVVAALNAESLSSGRKLTVASARAVLGAGGLLAGSEAADARKANGGPGQSG